MVRSRVRFSRVYARKLSRLKNKLVGTLFQIDSRHSWGGVREFVFDVDGSAFLKRELMEWVLVIHSSQSYMWTGAHPCVLRASDLFL